MNKVKWC